MSFPHRLTCASQAVLGCPQGRTTVKRALLKPRGGSEAEAARGLEHPTPGKNIKGCLVPPILSMPSVTQMVVVKGSHRATFPPCAKGRGGLFPWAKERLPAALPSSRAFVGVGSRQKHPPASPPGLHSMPVLSRVWLGANYQLTTNFLTTEGRSPSALDLWSPPHDLRSPTQSPHSQMRTGQDRTWPAHGDTAPIRES